MYVQDNGTSISYTSLRLCFSIIMPPVDVSVLVSIFLWAFLTACIAGQSLTGIDSWYKTAIHQIKAPGGANEGTDCDKLVL